MEHLAPVSATNLDICWFKAKPSLTWLRLWLMEYFNFWTKLGRGKGFLSEFYSREARIKFRENSLLFQRLFDFSDNLF